LVDVNLLYDLPNQILVERLRSTFIVDVKYEKLSLFCSNCKMIGHDLSNCRWLQQDVNVTSGGEKIVGTKIQFYHPKVVGTHGYKGSPGSFLKPLEVIVQPVVEPIKEHVLTESLVKPVVDPIVFVVDFVVNPIGELVLDIVAQS